MALTTNSFNGSVVASYDTVKETFPQSTASTGLGIGRALTTDTLIGGTGYSDDTGVTTTGGGTGLTVDITTTVGVVTGVTVVNSGVGYLVGDIIAIDGGNDDASFEIATISGDEVEIIDRNVFGNGTKFLTDFQEGDFIWLLDTDEVRKIENIVSDTKMTMQHNGTATAGTPTDFKVVKNMGFKKVAYFIDAIGAAKINGVNFPKSAQGDFNTSNVFFPILIDSTANSNIVSIIASNS